MPDSPASAPRPLHITYAGSHPARPFTPDEVVPTAPWLAGETEDRLFRDARWVGTDRDLRLFERDDLLVGAGRVPFGSGDLPSRAGELYDRVLAATRGRHLYRVWSYVPRINAITAGLENYRAFCQGRSLAFERALGPGFQRGLCAASAVGCDGDDLELVFAAGAVPPRHVENPAQVPAYEYPLEHGPRPPSFARATVVSVGPRQYTFISGTAAIKGHATVPGTLREQLDCTCDNLRLISREVGAGDDLRIGPNGQRHFKVYLRRAQDLAEAQRVLAGRLLRGTDFVTYLRADICRAALDVEIEATLVQ